MLAAGIQPGKACKPILHVLASKEGASCQPSPKARAFRKNGYLARGLKANAINVPKNTAAAMPPAVADNPPVKAPMKPISSTALITP